MNGPEATAIVVTYNSSAHIIACLTALRQADAAVQVVDNASCDNTADLVAAHFPEVALRINTANVGFAAAVNQALAGVRTDVVILVNPDCVLPAATAHALLCTVRAQPHVGVAGPRIVGPDGRTAISAHPFETWFSVLASRFGGSLLPTKLRWLLCGGQRRRVYDACLEPGHPTAVDWVSGACLAARTSLLRQLGGLDEGYFMFYEDEELCLQAWRQGAHVVYVPAVTATHVGGASTSDDPSRVWPHLYSSMLRFFARHRRRSYPLVRAIVLLRAVIGIGCAFARLPAHRTTALARVRAWSRVLRLAATARIPLPEGQQSCAS
ncbi:glycosyltransferase family 2 protein [Streptantibioticus ferralitis]|uniref:Glycosyltransferase family 2 protein n=1 Tax=Streptantibioticus ferralitis TaxID=236510 RepID=A0ABT5Z0T5_9ACTN|nr:glycosyltransferase family 2 protein [Streptantibioticus ferralitis]MDF2257453.1 glycosyltransferase family 2 protein [Streptantibioticus ferralitis]